jgi:hypothetical protein
MAFAAKWVTSIWNEPGKIFRPGPLKKPFIPWLEVIFGEY